MGGCLDTSRYLPLNELYDCLQNLARAAPNSVKLESIGNTHIQGKSFQNEIYLVTIGNENDPILHFDCGMHSREWISPATCLYLIKQLTLSFENKYRAGIKKTHLYNYQWQFIPMANPDGYAKSHIRDDSGKENNRFHRKNMRPWKTIRSHLSADMIDYCETVANCLGVDLNRNFPGGWGLGYEEFENVKSKQPWTDVFKGTHPLSEPETRAFHNHMLPIKERTLLAISVHSYSQEIIHPKGWLRPDDPDQIKGEQKERLRRFAEYFNKPLGYRIGAVAEIMHESQISGGATDDYYWTTLGINLSYTVELDPHGSQDDGHKLPAKNIRSVGSKMWKALNLMALKLDQMYPYHRKN